MDKIQHVIRHWSLWMALAILFTSAIGIYNEIVSTNGTFVYLLDDTYIHMATARSIATDGVWGVTTHEFSSSNSSILYPLLLAGLYRFFGVQIYLPLLINLVSASAVLVVCYSVLQLVKASNFITLLTLIILFLVIPLPLMVFIGMEHTIHILLYISFLVYVSTVLARPMREIDATSYLILSVGSLLLGSVRYESLFTIYIVAAIFMLRWRWREALIIIFAGSLPSILFGIFSIANGGLFLPNSIYLKTNVPNTGGIWSNLSLEHINFLILRFPMTYFLFLLGILLYGLVGHSEKNTDNEENQWQFEAIYLLILGTNIFCHGFFARFGWLLRYEAYLVAAGILIIAVLAIRLLKLSRLPFLKVNAHALILLATLIIPSCLVIQQSIERTLSLEKVSEFSNYIYSQHMQLGWFAGKYYHGDNIVASDIGAIALFADPQLTDLLGLGTLDFVTTGFLLYDANYVRNITKANGANIAIIQEGNVGIQRIPDEWVKVATWEIAENPFRDAYHVGYVPQTSFYAINPDYAEDLIRNLIAYEPSLPATVVVDYVAALFDSDS